MRANIVDTLSTKSWLFREAKKSQRAWLIKARARNDFTSKASKSLLKSRQAEIEAVYGNKKGQRLHSTRNWRKRGQGREVERNGSSHCSRSQSEREKAVMTTWLWLWRRWLQRSRPISCVCCLFEDQASCCVAKRITRWSRCTWPKGGDRFSTSHLGFKSWHSQFF